MQTAMKSCSEQPKWKITSDETGTKFMYITMHSLYLPKTIAKVFVALRSFFADDFSRFFFDALWTL